ncbi:MAG: beta-N-acetylglucosaminidase domain-containing protein [Verrucomicrobiales bacterium]|nr:beta-N-acetylglucosaminidase domain-containing protein [Verrucomicrobiales bacterium]
MHLPSSSPGVIEGFFGRPWSWEARRAYADFLQRNDYQYYLYAPKADRVLREDWPDRWPEETYGELQGLREVYREAGVAWGVGLNLYELHCHCDEDAIRKLEAKIRYINGLQPDILAILFDDMRGDADEIAQTQVDVTHRACALSTASSVIMCPTYYSDSPVLDRIFGERPAGYLESLGKSLDPTVHIFWTGAEVCSDAYPVEHLQSVGERLGRKPFIWDNYPVNDSEAMCRHLHLRAFENRPNEMANWIAGHAVNPMNQAYLSQIPLMTLNRSYGERGSYNPVVAFEEAARELCGGEFASCLADDLFLFQDCGLDQMDPALKDRLVSKYEPFQTPFSREVVGWLRGEYPYALDCLTE